MSAIIWWWCNYVGSYFCYNVHFITRRSRVRTPLTSRLRVSRSLREHYWPGLSGTFRGDLLSLLTVRSRLNMIRGHLWAHVMQKEVWRCNPPSVLRRPLVLHDKAVRGKIAIGWLQKARDGLRSFLAPSCRMTRKTVVPMMVRPFASSVEPQWCLGGIRSCDFPVTSPFPYPLDRIPDWNWVRLNKGETLERKKKTILCYNSDHLGHHGHKVRLMSLEMISAIVRDVEFGPCCCCCCLNGVRSSFWFVWNS